MNLLNDIKALYDKWDGKGGQSGDDKYEDALYDCINELGDVITKHEKAASQPAVEAGANTPCSDCAYPAKLRRCGRLWPSERTA